MNILFKHIANDTLTQDVLIRLIAEGCDINLVNQRGATPLVYAYKKSKNNSIKLLLDNGADLTVYEKDEDFDELIDSGTTILDLARKDNNIPVLLFLLKLKACQNALDLQKLQKNPEKYDEATQRWIQSEAHALDNNKEPDIRKTIANILARDSVLQKYPQLLTLVDSIINLEYTIDLTGGNADDKYEIAIIELETTKKHQLEYFYRYNWSYDESICIFVWHTEGKKQRIWDIKRFFNESFSENKKSMQALAEHLLGKKNAIPLEDFKRFLIVLLSRMVQKNWYTLDDKMDKFKK